jgi:hypothetical protein
VLSCKETFAHRMRRRCCSEDRKSIASNRPALIALTTGMSVTDAGQGRACRNAHCYQPKYIQPYADNGWFNFRFLGDFWGPCGPELRKAIEIDTPDDRKRYALVET